MEKDWLISINRMLRILCNISLESNFNLDAFSGKQKFMILYITSVEGNYVIQPW